MDSYELKATVLIDNDPNEDLAGEWGLSILIEFGGKHVLLDTGATSEFAANADKLGVSLADVELGVLSHAHFDHSDGLDAFFAANDHAPFYLCEGSAENCYAKHGDEIEYIGIGNSALEKHASRLVFASGLTELFDDVWLLSHSTPRLEAIGEAAQMYQLIDGQLEPDNFSHEQSLIFKTHKGLVVFNSCSHGGVANIIKEVKAAFDGQPIHAFIGGFHLFKASDSEVESLARAIDAEGIERIATGHCTGERACEILESSSHANVDRFHSGLCICI